MLELDLAPAELLLDGFADELQILLREWQAALMQELYAVVFLWIVRRRNHRACGICLVCAGKIDVLRRDFSQNDVCAAF